MKEVAESVKVTIINLSPRFCFKACEEALKSVPSGTVFNLLSSGFCFFLYEVPSMAGKTDHLVNIKLISYFPSNAF